MNYVFDLDGTLCTNTNSNYATAQPLIERINIVNRLYDEGNKITIYTARGMKSGNNNILKAYIKYYFFTKKQLKLWNIKYHHLFLGKPYDFLIGLITIF